MTVSTAAIGTAVLAALDGLGLRIAGVDALIDHVERQIVGEAWSMEPTTWTVKADGRDLGAVCDFGTGSGRYFFATRGTGSGRYFATRGTGRFCAHFASREEAAAAIYADYVKTGS